MYKFKQLSIISKTLSLSSSFSQTSHIKFLFLSNWSGLYKFGQLSKFQIIQSLSLSPQTSQIQDQSESNWSGLYISKQLSFLSKIPSLSWSLLKILFKLFISNKLLYLKSRLYVFVFTSIGKYNVFLVCLIKFSKFLSSQ